MIVGRRGHPLRNARSLSELVDADWLLRSPPEAETDSHPWWFTELFEKQGLTPPRSIVRSDGHTFISLLLSTDVVSVHWPDSILYRIGAIESFEISAHLPTSPAYTEYLVLRAGSLLTPAAAAMVAAVKAEARKLAFSDSRV